MSTALDWTDLDDRAVDTARALAMDAVQKVGNGHPGTAMSLAPAAYLLFQKVMRHDPADPDWFGRDRFVLSCGHSSLTLYVQLYLGGFGLALDDLKALRTWGSRTPGHPEHGHTAGVETTTGPLGQGVGQRGRDGDGRPARARPARPRRRRPAQSPFDHYVYAICSDGDIEEGVSAEASSLAGHQQLGNLVLIYDNNQISIEDDTDIAFSEDVVQALRGVRLARAGRRLDQRRHGVRRGRARPCGTRCRRPRRSPTGPASSTCTRSSPGPRPKAQNTGKAHGSALGEAEVAATKKVMGIDPDQTFEVAEDVLAHTRGLVARGADEHDAWRGPLEAWAPGNPDGAALLERLGTRTCPTAGPTRCRRSRPTPRASRPGRRPATC